MSAAGAAAFAGVALTGWPAMGWWPGCRNDKRLAASRAGVTQGQFVATLSEHGADADIAEEMFDGSPSIMVVKRRQTFMTG